MLTSQIAALRAEEERLVAQEAQVALLTCTTLMLAALPEDSVIDICAHATDLRRYWQTRPDAPASEDVLRFAATEALKRWEVIAQARQQLPAPVTPLRPRWVRAAVD